MPTPTESLPLQPGNWSSLNDYLSTTSSAVSNTAAASLACVMQMVYDNAESFSLLTYGDSLSGDGNGGGDAAKWVRTWLGSFIPACNTLTPGRTFTFKYDSWGGGSFTETTLQTGSGPNTITVYNLALPGVYWDYLFGKMSGLQTVASSLGAGPIVCFAMMGKNGGTWGETQLSDAIVAVETLLRMFPRCQPILLSQPPDIPPATDARQDLRARQYQQLAQMRGFGYIDVYRAFVDTGNVAAYMSADGIHPNAAGYTLIANEVMRGCSFQRGEVPRGAHNGSTLDRYARNLLVNGEFTTYPPGAEWVNTNVTVTQDTRAGYWETRKAGTGYSVRMRSASAAPAKMVQTLSAVPFRGQTLTMLARLRQETGVSVTANGRVAVDDGVTGGVTSRGFANAVGSFLWASATKQRIDMASTTITVSLHVDTLSSGTADISVDRSFLVRGAFPVDATLLDS